MLHLLALFEYCLFLFASSRSIIDSKMILGSNISNQSLSSSELFNCSFVTEEGIGEKQIVKFIDEEKELIFIRFHLLNVSNIFPSESDRHIYGVLNLVRTAGGFGNELLLMHPQFEQLSLGILMFGVEHIDIQLKPMHSECFDNSIKNKLYTDLISFATNEFDLIEDSANRICSMVVDDIDGRAEFNYKCCARNDKGSFECRMIENNFWIRTLFFFMTFIYVMAFLYSPLLIPTSWYKDNASTYSFDLTEDLFFFNKSSKEKKEAEGILLKNNNITHMDKLNSYLDGLKKSPCVHLKVNKVMIILQEMKTVSSTFVPAGIFHFLYRTFIKCNVENHADVKECCEADCCNCLGCKGCKWHKCLKPFMQIVFLFCLLLPWCFRVLFFYFNEEEDRNYRKNLANELKLEYPNIFQWSLTYSLKPDHSFFIVCYILSFCIFFTKSYVKEILNAAEIDKIDKIIGRCFKMGLKKVLVPCQKFGIIGVVMCPIYMILIAPYILFFYLLPSIPLISVSFTLVFGLLGTILDEAKKTWEENKIKGVAEFFVLLIVSILIFLTLAAPMVLCLEVIVFVLEIILYVTIGIILNASRALMYVTFAGMLLFYAYSSIRQVRKKYEQFIRTVMEHFISDMEDYITGSANNGVIQKCAVQFLNRNGNVQQSIKFKDDIILESQIPILFFDDNGKPFLNEDVFFKLCRMKSIGAPGLIWKNYGKAFLNFLVIAMFLLLVASIVLAFGESKGIPDTYQALATLGGGLIPLILQKYLFKYHDESNFETKHCLFQSELKGVFKDYKIHFEIEDIEGTNVAIDDLSKIENSEKINKIYIVR